MNKGTPLNDTLACKKCGTRIHKGDWARGHGLCLPCRMDQWALRAVADREAGSK